MAELFYRKIYMALIIVSILLIGYVLIATGHITNVNRAAVAMFMGTVGWVLYICYGTDFVMSQYPHDYSVFLGGIPSTSSLAKSYIASNIFLKYVGRGAEIVLFLLATMTIVEILNNNGCFDFISKWIKTRNSHKLLWAMAVTTFIISANLDNLTTTMMMLVIMHKLLPNRRQRMIYGCAIVIAANCGGACLVIQKGDKLVALVYPDYEEAKNMGFSNEDLQHIMEQNLIELNEIQPSYSKVSMIKLQEEEFEKTPKKSIKRYLYKNVEI